MATAIGTTSVTVSDPPITGGSAAATTVVHVVGNQSPPATTIVHVIDPPSTIMVPIGGAYVPIVRMYVGALDGSAWIEVDL